VSITLLASGCIACAAAGATAPPASASLACGIAGFFSGFAGKACNFATGPVGGILKKVLGGTGSSASSGLKKAAEIVAIGAAATVAAVAAVKIVSEAIGESTSPQLTSTWFSGTYWRVTAIAALLTLPFLFAAAVQALMRSDITLLIRAALGYLPLAILVTAIAAPLTMLLLSASDEMSVIVSSAAPGTHHFLLKATLLGGLFDAAKDSPLLLFVVGMLATAFAVAVWLELAVREAAIYVIVLMLPLMFSAMVWPARRVWAIRAVEILVALILSKFVIVAVLSLGAGALGHVGVVSAIAGIALLMLAAFSPWMLLRLLPMAELAGAAAGSMSEKLRSHGSTGVRAVTGADPIGHVHQTMRDLAGAATALRNHESLGGDDVHTSRAGSFVGTGGTLGGATTGVGGGGGPSGGGGGGGSGPSGGGGGGGSGSGAPGGTPTGGGGAPPNGAAEPIPASATASTNDATHENGDASEILSGTLDDPQPITFADHGFDPASPPASRIDLYADPGEDQDLRPDRQPDLDDEP
jgi:hypothetical protein